MKFSSGAYAAIDRDAANFIESQIVNAEVGRNPFPHIYVRNILPLDLYAEMAANLPSEEQFAETKEIAPHFNIVGDGHTPPLLSGHAKLWTEKYSGYIDLINRCLSERMAKDIDRLLACYRRVGMIGRPPNVFTGQSLFCLRPSGWGIAPHSHNFNEIVQSLIFFPSPGSPETLGTSLYQVKRHIMFERKHMNRDTPWHPRDVEKVQRTRYEANAMFSFLNFPLAVHAAEGQADMPARRYIFTKVMMPVNFKLAEEKTGILSSNAFDISTRERPIDQIRRALFG